MALPTDDHRQRVGAGKSGDPQRLGDTTSAGREITAGEIVGPANPPVDSLGERLNNKSPRLSRLERFYGERETRPRLRHARHVDLESAPARSTARVGNRGSDPADVEGHSARRAGLTLSGALSFGSAGMDQSRMGCVR